MEQISLFCRINGARLHWSAEATHQTTTWSGCVYRGLGIETKYIAIECTPCGYCYLPKARLLMYAQICGDHACTGTTKITETLDARVLRPRKKRSLWTCACSKHSSLLQVGDDLARSLCPAQCTGVSNVTYYMIFVTPSSSIWKQYTPISVYQGTDLLLYFIGRKGFFQREAVAHNDKKEPLNSPPCPLNYPVG